MIKKVNYSLKDYSEQMFTNKNLIKYYKNINEEEYVPKIPKMGPPQSFKVTTIYNNINSNKEKEKYYKINQTDTLFWCFYILKNGYSKYEMEIAGQYFVVEKTEKFRYIDVLRQNTLKDKLKIHNIKPFTEIEDDLAHKDKISIKTFFALCIAENINIMLVDKRKIYELKCNESGPVNLIHKDNGSFTYYIENEPSSESLLKYKTTYYVMPNFDATLKSMASYKVEDLIELCNKFDIKLDDKKKLKKDYYELLQQQF